MRELKSSCSMSVVTTVRGLRCFPCLSPSIHLAFATVDVKESRMNCCMVMGSSIVKITYCTPSSTFRAAIRELKFDHMWRVHFMILLGRNLFTR